MIVPYSVLFVILYFFAVTFPMSVNLLLTILFAVLIAIKIRKLFLNYGLSISELDLRWCHKVLFSKPF